MPRPLIVVGPQPVSSGEETYWCAVCVATWKAALVAMLGIDAEWIKRELDGNEDDKPKIIAPPPGAKMPPLNYAVTMMTVGSVGGPALVCWTHADAFSDVQVIVPPGNGQQRLIPGMS